jgi:S1-C subfamily serine protease
MKVIPRMTAAIVLLLAALGVAPGGRLGAQTPPGKRYAVLVGINRYEHPNLVALRYAENDVAELADVLRGAGYEVTLLTGSAGPDLRATKANVERRLRAAVERCRPPDTLVVAFAGHGLQFGGEPDSYFCPVDARPFRSEAGTFVSLGGVYREMERSFAGVKVLLVDACRNDPAAARGVRARGIDADTAPRPPRGVGALFSCSAGESALEDDRLKHGLFFHYLIRGLRREAADRDGEVTFEGLSAYVRKQVVRAAPQLLGDDGVRQSPNLKADLSGESPVLLTVARGGGVASKPTPAGPAVQSSPREDSRAKTERPIRPGEMYRAMLRSTVGISADPGNDALATGSGSLVDRDRRLVLTSYRVVGGSKTATVFFAAFEGERVVSETEYYIKRTKELGIRGEVIEVDKQSDLALIRLDQVPEKAEALALATTSPRPGEEAYSIGSTGGDTLWVYSSGKIRQLFTRRWTVNLSDGTEVSCQGKVIEIDSPSGGAGGGPLVNSRGELIGVAQGRAAAGQPAYTHVDIAEARTLVNLRSTRTTPATVDPPNNAAKPARDFPLTSKDEATFFSVEAMKKAQTAADRLFKEKGIDFMIETYNAPPSEDPDRVKALSPAAKTKFFGELARERATAEKATGVYVLVCKNPTYLYVHVTTGSGLTTHDLTSIRDTLMDSFRKNKFDDGLIQAIQVVLDAKGLGER